jgi:uncharacterized protein
MKRVLYLHGLESSNTGDKIDFLYQHSIACTPSINYLDIDIEEKLVTLVENFKPDVIIGSSMGGYVGMLLANKYHIDCLVFNPAIHSRPFSPELNNLEKDDAELGFYPIVVLGMKDDVVNPLITKELLKDIMFEYEIEEIEDMGHRVSFPVFVDMYNKHVI